MVIEKSEYLALIEVQARAQQLQEKLAVHAKTVAVALYGDDVYGISFHADHVGVRFHPRFEDDGRFSPDLLFDPNWESKVREIHEKSRAQAKAIADRHEREALKAAEERDRKELARLQAKYPDAGGKS